MKFNELYKKVIDSHRAFEERRVPISLDIKIEDLRDALVESNETIEKLVDAKKSAEQILQNLLDCGLIKEWYFNGKFNAVLKADDPHLQIAELKQKLEDAEADAAETLTLLEERNEQVGELIEKNKRLARKDLIMASETIKDLLKQLRHHKYKRCLMMARWCASRSASWCLDPADEQLHKSDFYDKWKKRWLELAEKLKEAK